MKPFRPRIGAQRGLRYILIAQLLLAGLLMTERAFTMLPAMARNSPGLPSGPISPGDQRRDYRTDRPEPGLLTTDGPSRFELPESFPNRLAFEEKTLPEDGRVLFLVGQIQPGDAARFEDFLATLPEKPDLIALHSPGGAVGEAQKIGRHIRENALPTAIMEGGFCASSCPYMLAGGTTRRVSRQGAVGLHQHYYEQPGYMPAMFAVESIQSGQGQTMEFLIDMGIAPAVMVYSLKTPPEQIYVLVEEELIDTKMATEVVD